MKKSDVVRVTEASGMRIVLRRYFRLIVRDEVKSLELVSKIELQEGFITDRTKLLNVAHEVVYGWMREQALKLPPTFNGFLK